MVNVIALISGLIFGWGLILSGMVNPDIVLAFLDITGHWNASLLWVMGGAITVGSLAFFMAGKHQQSFLGLSIDLPTAKTVDKRLMLGSLIFGAGWGIAGICPGPALVLAGAGNDQALVFIAAMLLGMGLFEDINQNR